MSGLARLARPFDAVVSPYHLTSREPAAMVMLQLAERVVTLLLAPMSARRESAIEMAGVLAEARRSPVYVRYMSSWEWAEEFFREGIIGSTHGEEDPVDEVRLACARLGNDPALSPLSRFVRPDLFADDRAYLRAAASDVLKAGPDPGVSIPIAAGLDAFAGAHGLIVARSAAVSLAQKAESRLGRVVFRVSVPALLQGSSARVMLSRALLDDERVRLARAVTEAFESGEAGGVRAAATAYARAFDRERPQICCPPGPAEADEVRVIVGEVSLAGVELPADAVMRSSLAAAGAAGGPASASGAVRSIVVRAMGR